MEDRPQALHAMGEGWRMGTCVRSPDRQHGTEAAIPWSPTGKKPIPYDFEAYRVRNTIERCLNKLKHFRRIATRFGRRAEDFLGFLQLAASKRWMR